MCFHGRYSQARFGASPGLQLVAILLSPLIFGRAFAASLADYTLDYVGSSYGLPQSSVRALAQDSAGFLWVGSESGLHRFDGKRFELIEPPFGHGVVNSILTDSRGRIWTSWFSRPTTIYNPETRQWRELDIRPPRALLLGFLEDPDGRIWLNDGSVLYVYNEEQGRPEPALRYASGSSSGRTLEMVWHDGAVWLSGTDGVLGFDVATGALASSSLQGATPAIALLKSSNTIWSCHGDRVLRKNGKAGFEPYLDMPRISILSCAHDQSGQLWIGTESSGAFLARSATDVQHFRHADDDVSSIGFNRVSRIYPTPSGPVWLISPRQISLYEDARFFHYEYDRAGFETGSLLFAGLNIIEDRSGVVWIGTAKDGLIRSSRYSRKFRSTTPPGSDTRTGRPVMDRSGNLWVAMKHNGVFRWNRSQDAWSHFEADLDDPQKLPTREVRALLITSDNEVYAGSRLGLLSKYDAATGGWSRIQVGGEQPINSLLELPDRRIVIGRQGLLTIYDPATSAIRQFPLSNTVQVRTIALSRSGRVWVGTANGAGLLELDPGRGIVRSWPALFGSLRVMSLFEDRLGYLWIGTWGHGLHRFDPQGNTVQAVLPADGHQGQTIAAILPGAEGDIWMATENGLVRVRNCLWNRGECAPDITTYDSSHGLVNNWYSADSSSVASSGELFVGGSKGIDYFQPSLFEENRIPPAVSLIEVMLNGSPLTGVSSSGGEIDLPYSFGELVIRFAATDFHDSAKNQYRYRMDGREPWISLGNRNQITLRNLQAGSYRLEIAGSNNDGIWNERPIRMSVLVASPMYARWWAVLLYGLAVISLLIGVSEYRKRRQREYVLMLEQQVEARTSELHKANSAMADFYANVSHEVRTPLTLIYSAVDQLQEETESGGARSLISAIRRHTQSLSRYVDGLITVSQLESGTQRHWRAADARSHIEQLIKDFAPMGGRREIEFRTTLADRILVKTQSNALDTILSNLMMNAIKHTPDDGHIRIAARTDTAFVYLSFDDNGPGIEPAIREKIFDRGMLYSKAGGYGIGLYLVKQTAVALGGDVVAGESATLGGASFRVTLPLADRSLPLLTVLAESTLPDSSEPRQQDEHEAASGKSSGLAILIVEDNEEYSAYLGRVPVE